MVGIGETVREMPETDTGFGGRRPDSEDGLGGSRAELLGAQSRINWVAPEELDVTPAMGGAGVSALFVDESPSTPGHAGGALTTIPWADHPNLSPSLQRAFAPCSQDLIARMLELEQLHQSGALRAEVERLGISGAWLDALRAEGPRAVVSEQQQFVPNLYAALGAYGTPGDVLGGLSTLQCLGAALSAELGQEVRTGYLMSRFHGVSFEGVTFGGYVTVPGLEDDAISRTSLFSKSDRARFDYATYGDLSISPARLVEISTLIEKFATESDRRARKHLQNAERQAEHNKSVAENLGSVPDEKQQRFEQESTRGAYFDVRAKAAAMLLEDFRGAQADCQGSLTTDGRYPYTLFVEKFNARFVARVMPGLEFSTFANDVVDDLPTLGIENWGTFARALVSSGILGAEEAICRVRTVTSDGRIRYANAWIQEIQADTVLVGLKGIENPRERIDIRELVAESRASKERGEGPTLVPVGRLRYLANLAWSPSLVLYDGADYEPINKVVAAMADPNFLLNPRAPKMHAYSRVFEHKPASTSAPWKELDERHHTIQYYADLVVRERK